LRRRRKRWQHAIVFFCGAAIGKEKNVGNSCRHLLLWWCCKEEEEDDKNAPSSSSMVLLQQKR
jgi:hypothetical protein